MLRYIFLSVFALLLLTACGGSDTDSSSNDLDSVYENTTGARIDTDKGSTTDLDTLNKTNRCAGCDLTGVVLIKAKLVGAILKNADLSGADLTGANLTRANLTGANLTGANLTGANLYWAKLSGTNLSGANLTGADLSGAVLDTGADLSEAKLDGVIGANLTNALNVPAKYLKD
jgi:uncharacterized protein YjbI with pentapeptide repeats